MIQEDAVNLQKQLVHLFRVFEVEVAVGLHRNNKDGYGVRLITQDPQVQVSEVGKVKKQGKKKDVLSGPVPDVKIGTMPSG